MMACVARQVSYLLSDLFRVMAKPTMMPKTIKPTRPLIKELELRPIYVSLGGPGEYAGLPGKLYING